MDSDAGELSGAGAAARQTAAHHANGHTPEAEPPNVARHLAHMAATQPERIALKIPRGRGRGAGGSAAALNGRIDYLELTFRELEAEVEAWCARLLEKSGDGRARAGRCVAQPAGASPCCEVEATAAEAWRGVRVLVMLRQGLPLIAAVFALFKLGAVPIVIDPGMGLKNFLRCVARSRPQALVGIPLAQAVSRLFWRTFASVRWRVWASGSLTGRLSRAYREKDYVGGKDAAPAPDADALAAILFTSGSTGSPKGVCYTHAMFEAQLALIRDHYGIAPGEVDLPLLPIFALFNPALGMTSIVPELDPRRPAQASAAALVQAILQEGVTNSFGSPTLWLKIKRHCLAHGITLPSLRRILCAGAPVPAELWEDTARWLPNGQIHSPYGATEALPLCSISSDEVAALRRDGPTCERTASPHKETCAPGGLADFGACVGKPLPGITVKIVEIVDGPIRSVADVREVPRGEIGEIVVGGPNVTQLYDALPEATARAKVFDEAPLPTSAETRPAANASQPTEGGSRARTEDTPPTSGVPHKNSLRLPRLLHRMGDAGYLDEAGRLWFCGRVVERVVLAGGRTLYTEPCEQVFRAHAQVERCALIGLDGGDGAAAQIPALVVQVRAASPSGEQGIDRAALAEELRALALAHTHTREIERFYFHPNFPVDVRHNAKIHRHTLARWAATVRAFQP